MDARALNRLRRMVVSAGASLRCHPVDEDALPGLSPMGRISRVMWYRLLLPEVLPACEAYGMGVVPWSPLAGGLLAGVLGKIEGGRRASDWVQEDLAKFRDRIEAYEKFCSDLGEQPADVALAWLLANPVVSAPIIGPRTVQQLDGSLRALELALDDDTLGRLDEIFPGPGGPAPEAYAW